MTTGASRGVPPDGGEPFIDPSLLQALRASAGRISAVEGTSVRQLHEDITGIVGHMPGNGRPFCERMVRTVLWMILGAESPGEILDGLYWLGSVNQAEGFPAAEYVTVAHALIRVVREMSWPRWETTTGSAWVQLFMQMQPHLLAAAREVAERQEAERRAAVARQEAARRRVFDQARRAQRRGDAEADVDVTAVAGFLADEDEDEERGPGYGQIMLGMTLNNRREQPL
jgi:hypothetical protein